jgi:hypothetical protein
MLMWCIYMCAHMSCSIVVMFTCTSVRSHPDSRRHYMWNLTRCNKQQNTGLGVATRCMLRGRGQKGLSSSLERGYEGHIREVLQEDSCSSMYSNYYITCSHVLSCALVIYLQFLTCRETDSWYWLVFIFRRLKINHDSHEFILESGTVANT